MPWPATAEATRARACFFFLLPFRSGAGVSSRAGGDVLRWRLPRQRGRPPRRGVGSTLDTPPCRAAAARGRAHEASCAPGAGCARSTLASQGTAGARVGCGVGRCPARAQARRATAWTTPLHAAAWPCTCAGAWWRLCRTRRIAVVGTTTSAWQAHFPTRTRVGAAAATCSAARCDLIQPPHVHETRGDAPAPTNTASCPSSPTVPLPCGRPAMFGAVSRCTCYYEAGTG